MTKRNLDSFKENDENSSNINIKDNTKKSIKLSIELPKTTTPYDDGYETEETVLEEDYVVPKDYVPPESSYQKYLKMMKNIRDKYEDGYETEDTVILDKYGNELKGGKKKYTKKVKQTKRKSKKNKKNKKNTMQTRKSKTIKRT